MRTASIARDQERAARAAAFKDTRVIGFDVDPIPRHRRSESRSRSPVLEPASDLIMGTQATLVYPNTGDRSALLQDFQVLWVLFYVGTVLCGYFLGGTILCHYWLLFWGTILCHYWVIFGGTNPYCYGVANPFY